MQIVLTFNFVKNFHSNLKCALLAPKMHFFAHISSLQSIQKRLQSCFKKVAIVSSKKFAVISKKWLHICLKSCSSIFEKGCSNIFGKKMLQSFFIIVKVKRNNFKIIFTSRINFWWWRWRWLLRQLEEAKIFFGLSWRWDQWSWRIWIYDS